MSASGPRATISSTGHADGLGRRALVFDREAGVRIERLTLRPELAACETLVAARAAALTAWCGTGVLRPVRVERTRAGVLRIESPLPPGYRLSEILEAAGEHHDQPLAGLDASLGLLAALLPILRDLHEDLGIVHGAVGPGRLYITSAGEALLLDAAYGAALERLDWPARRLWQELGVVAPEGADGRFTPSGDVAHAILAALMLLLGREISTPARVPQALDEVTEIGEIRGGVSFGLRLAEFFRRGLPPAGGFVSAAAALSAVRAVAEAAVDLDACRAWLGAVWDAMDQTPMGLPSPLAASDPPPRYPPTVVCPSLPALRLSIQISPPPAGGEGPAAAARSSTGFPVEEPSGIVEHRDPAPTAAVTVTPAGDSRESAPAAAARRDAPVAAAREDATGETGPGPAPPHVDAPSLPATESPRRKHSTRPDRGGKLRSSITAAQAAAPAEPPVPLAPPLPLAAPAPPLPPPAAPRPVFPPLAGPSVGGAPSSPYVDAAATWHPVPDITPAAQPVSISLKVGSVVRRPPESPARVEPPPPRYSTLMSPRPDEHPARGRRAVAATAVVVLAAGIAAARMTLPGRAGTPSLIAAAALNVQETPRTGTLQITSAPPGARVTIDGRPAGETPVTLTGVAPGHRTLAVTSGGATVQRTVLIEAGQKAAVDMAVFSGWLAVDAPIVLEVAQGGRVVGSTQQGRLLLPPGRHTITLSNADLGYRAARVITIQPGQEARLSLVPATRVNINASPWAEVWIDGRRVGETPVAELEVPLGTHEFLFRHPELGERRVTHTIRAGEPAAVSIDMSGPR